MGRASGVFLPGRGQYLLAKVTQATTAAPAITAPVIGELEAGTPTPARTSTGIYTFTLTGAFTVGKTFVRITPSAARHVAVVYTSANVFTVNFNDLATPSAADSGDFDMEIFIAN